MPDTRVAVTTADMTLADFETGSLSVQIVTRLPRLSFASDSDVVVCST